MSERQRTGVIDLLVTDKAVFEIDESGMTLIEVSPFSSLEKIKQTTGCGFETRL